MKDEYSELRAAFHAGETIQAYTLMPQFDDTDGQASLDAVSGYGYWRDLSCDGEPKFSCHPTRYRVKPEIYGVDTAKQGSDETVKQVFSP